MVFANQPPGSGERPDYSFVDLGDSVRVALMLAPQGRGPFAEQVREVLFRLQAVLKQQSHRMAITVQTVFLRDAGLQAECERLFLEHYGPDLPATNFVVQPPCCQAALALEAWAIGGESVRVEHHGPQALSVSYDSVRWIYCAGIKPPPDVQGVHTQATQALARMRAALRQAGSRFEHVVRTWLYLGGITEPEGEWQRYQELNRARTDCYRELNFSSWSRNAGSAHPIYPASTGIGMAGRGLVMSCLALETDRRDLLLLPLENPSQTPAFSYHPKYSPESPKFSRAIALALGEYLTTWISGTASIVHSESCYPGDIEKQTEQTIDNIERLIERRNFAAHGLKRAGAGLGDIAKIRVYIKRPEDFEKCRAVCARRFGSVPAIYAIADVCRPELLVEIEGVAFSRLWP